MRKTVKVGGEALDLLATGTTPIRYKSVFHEDIMINFSQICDEKKDGAELLDMASKLAYVMNKQAKDEVLTMSYDDYLTWLDTYEPMDFVHAATDITNVYLGTTKTKSQPKNAVSRPKGK